MKKILLGILLFLAVFSSYSQNPAKFNSGIELTPINAPIAKFGRVYFDTAQNIFFGYDGTEWINLGTKSTSQLINDGENGIHPFIDSSEVINSVSELTDVSAVWTGSGLSFDVIANRYPVNLTWETSLADEITLDAAHATLDRIDLIVAIAPIPQGVGQNGSVGFITGTPASANLVVPPDFNPALVYPIKIVLVEALATVPANTSNETIYDENLGIPTEWDFTSNTGSIVNSTNDPHSGTNSIEGTNTTYGATMTFTRSGSINTALIDSFDFWIKLKESIGNEYFTFQFFNSNSTSIGIYQLNNHLLEIPESLDWQRVVIPMTDLELPITDLLSITVKPYIGGFDGFFFDEFTTNLGQGSTGGSGNITNTSQLINDGEDGINSFITALDLVDHEFLIDGYWVDKKLNSDENNIEVGDQIRGNFAANNYIIANVLSLPHETKSNLDLFLDNYLDDFSGSFTLQSTSVSVSWSPTNVVNPGTTLDWTVSGGVTIATTTIDDPTFNFSSNTGTANVLIENADDLTGIGLDLLGITSVNLSSLLNITSLTLNNNLFTTLDVSNNNLLTLLHINNNSITTIDITNNTALISVDFSTTLLTGVDFSNNTSLTLINISNSSSFATLGVSLNTSLNAIFCNSTALSTLDISNNTLITSLSCQLNNFSASVTNQILADLVANSQNNGTLNYRNNETGQGVTDRATLITRGWTITNFGS